MSKPAASRGWIGVFCVVAVFTFLCIALLSARHPGARADASAASPSHSVTPAGRARIQAAYGALPLAFEQNQGQTDSQVKFMARGNGYTLFLAPAEAVFSLHSQSVEKTSSENLAVEHMNGKSARNREKALTSVVRMQLSGANSSANIAAAEQLPGKANYFLGNDPAKWHKDVPLFARVSYQDVYPGVSLAFHGAQHQLEFDFVLAPEANPAPIAFHFTGEHGLKTDESGNLVISSAAGDVVFHKPVAYQQLKSVRQPVEVRFVLKANNQVGFELGNYDRSRELVIDPSVSMTYASYLGGSAEDDAFGIAVDGSGNAYVTGQTESANFPVVGGLGTPSNGATFDVFVTAIAPSGASLLYSTYVGGAQGVGKGDDSGNAIAVDSSGDAYVAGGTASSNFPTTSGAFQTALGTGAASNAFLFELKAGGGSLVYSTYLGGTGQDLANGVAVDNTGNAYIGGFTSSADFPTSASPLQLYPGTTDDGFVTKISPLGKGSADLVYSTYLALGGVVPDSINALALDSSNNVYVTGAASSSTNFHTTTGAYQTTCGCSNGASDAFVTVINAAGTGYVYSTFLGGSSSDVGNGIAVDSAGNAYVTGATESTDFPTTKGALQTAYGGATDAFIAKLNSTGTALAYSTYLGGSGFDEAGGVAVDSNDNAYVTGQTLSTNFPTQNAIEASLNNGNNTTNSDAFVSELNTAGSKLTFSTYLGGSLDEDTTHYGAIAVDTPGANIYATGNTTSTDFPVTPSPGAFQALNGGGASDAFVAAYAQQTFTMSATTPAAVSPGTSGTSTVTLTAYSGYNSPVNLTCSVAGTGTPLPACSASSFSTNPVTPVASPGATSTLTITTTGASSAMFFPRSFFYGMWLPISGLALTGMGFSCTRSRRKKLVGFLMLFMVMAALLLMPACGGSSSGGGGGGGGGGGSTGTPAGSYTVTVTATGTDAAATTQTAVVTLTVN